MLKRLHDAIFNRDSAPRFNAELLEDARRDLAKHEAATEYHAAMVDLYKGRIARLESAAK